MYNHQSNAGFGAILKLMGALSIGFTISQPANSAPIIIPVKAKCDSVPRNLAGSTITMAEYSHVTPHPDGTWSEHGYLKVTDVNGVALPSGLNSAYTLYLEYTTAGIVATGEITDLPLTLYCVNGASKFSLDSNHDAYANNTGTPIILGRLSRESGHIQGIPTVSAVVAMADLTYVAEPEPGTVNVVANSPLAVRAEFRHPVDEPGFQVELDGNNQLVGFSYNGGNTNFLHISPDLPQTSALPN